MLAPEAQSWTAWPSVDNDAAVCNILKVMLAWNQLLF